MKNFKRLASSMIIFFALAASAQPGGYKDPKKLKIYAKIYGSYGILTPGSFKGSSYLQGGEPVRFKAAKNAMGNGLYYGAGVGIIFNNFWNIGISGEYLRGNKITISQTITSAESDAFPASGYSLESNRTYNYSFASIIPNVVFKSISQPSFYVYTRVGLQIGIPLEMTETENSHYHYHNQNARRGLPVNTGELWDSDIITTSKGKNTLKPALGYQLATGIQFLLTQKLRGFFEISVNRISYNRDTYEDIERHRIWDRTFYNMPKPPIEHSYSKLKNVYINEGSTGLTITGPELNQLFSYRIPQEPVNVNSINAGFGFAYIF